MSVTNIFGEGSKIYTFSKLSFLNWKSYKLRNFIPAGLSFAKKETRRVIKAIKNLLIVIIFCVIIDLPKRNLVCYCFISNPVL